MHRTSSTSWTRRRSKELCQCLCQCEFLFRKRYVLQITEPEEPFTIRWQDLNLCFAHRMRIIVTIFTITLLMNAGVSVFVGFIHAKFGYIASAISISFTNIMFPEICKVFTNMEPHKCESDYQTSLLPKISLFRFVNTAIVINSITPFPYYLGTNSTNSLLPLVYALLFAYMIISNTSQLQQLLHQQK